MTTDRIVIPPKKILLSLILEYGMVWIMAGLCLCLSFIVLGFIIDFRFYFLALFSVFVIIPLILAFIYFYHGLKPLTAYNVIPHSIEIDNNDLKINLFGGGGSDKDSTNEEGLQENRRQIEMKNYKVSKIKTGTDYFLVFMNSPVEGILHVPVGCMEDPIHFKKLFNYFQHSMNENIKRQ